MIVNMAVGRGSFFFKLMNVGMTMGGGRGRGGRGHLGGQIGHSKCVLIEKG